MRKNWKKLALAALILCLIIAVRVMGLDEYFTFENLRLYRGRLELFVAAHYAESVLIYIALYVAVAALSIPGAAILSLAGGFLFGLLGVAYVNAGATAGATLAFLSARYLLGGWIQEKYGDRLAAFNREVAENGYNYLLTLRFIPLFPFFLINIFAGLTRVPLLTFIWTTAAGIIPGSFVYVFAGMQLGSINGPGDVLSWKIIAAFALLGMLAAVPVAVKKLRRKAQ
jgi:uncharacterized membrane protein YdjX (TVP38/TMEM64 family)